MKSRLSTHDIVVLIQELKIKLVGLRVDQVYDLDKKSYLIRLAKTDMKKLLLIESGSRFHTTSFEWPKNPAPSGFTMKLRKHLNNKRLENISQLGADRVVDFQFGQEAFTFHIILELYDKGNIILTDQNYNILSLVRPHMLGEDRIAAHEKYAVDKVKLSYSLPVAEIPIQLKDNPTKSLREVFLSKVEFGPALLSFVLKEQGLTPTSKIPKEEDTENFRSFEEKVVAALERGRLILEKGDVLGGFILTNPTASKPRQVQTKSKDGVEPVVAPLIIYDQFHPLLIAPNFPESQVIEFPTLDEAVDDFFSKVEAQKIDLKQVNQERDAMNKLERVKADQRKRMEELKLVQEEDKKKAELIMFNQELIEKAIGIIRQLIANQLSWDDIWEQIKEAQQKGDPLASKITALNLIKNRFSMQLRDPYEGEEEKQGAVEIDLDLSAYANASKYYDLKKASAKKEERTFESQEKALKSTEKKTMTSLREVAAIQLIKKARKVFWFEKFRWFISSENYLVLGGQDAQQNELLVKRYMKPKDIYLHADSHGAPTIIIKNDGAPNPVLPKTLNEAGTMAICASGAWDTKIVPSAWWVWGEQVSKSAPTGEYLPTGSFMIRGKKNFLPPTQLVLGFGFLFRLSDESMPKHVNERARRVHTSSIGEAILELERRNSVENDTTESEDDDENQFPDTKLQLEDDVLGRPTGLSSLSISSFASSSTIVDEHPGDDVSFITSGTVKAMSMDSAKMRQNQKKAAKKGTAGGKGSAKPTAPAPPPPEPAAENSSNKPKRGQHGRKKKLKEKYKFQDDEERELRMQLLQAKPKGDTPVAAATVVTTAPLHPVIAEEHEDEDKTENEEDQDKKSSKQVKTPKPVAADEPDVPDPVETPEVEVNLLNSLTGSPLDDDELLFAIPVIAPYTTLQNYKYRIKMLPGSTKRGKAARNAVETFIRDKQATNREKDLLKSVKDQDLARNFPGKVKLAGGSERK